MQDIQRRIEQTEETVRHNEYFLSVVKDDIREIKEEISSLKEDMVSLRVEDRKSQAHVLYLLVVLVITLVTKLMTEHNILENIKNFLGF